MAPRGSPTPLRPKVELLCDLAAQGLATRQVATRVGLSLRQTQRLLARPETQHRLQEILADRRRILNTTLVQDMQQRRARLLERFDELVEQSDHLPTAFRAVQEGFERLEPRKPGHADPPMLHITLSGETLAAMHAAVEKRDQARALLEARERTIEV